MKKSGSYNPPLVISIHGIRTRGEWQKLFASAMSGSRTEVESFDYDYYGLPRFLIPGFNSRLVDRFYNEYWAMVKSHPSVSLDHFDRRPSAVAHSLGSWILGNAMLKFEDIKFDKLILAGSILPRDFDWSILLARDQVAMVRNECGQRDPWPGWAGRLVARSGTGGRDGFDWLGSVVDNARCEWFGHSDALMRPHIERIWLPFLRRTPSPLGLLHGCDIQDGQEFSRLLDHTGTVIDPQAYGNIPHYPNVEIPRGLSLSWIKVNPDIYTFLIDRQTRQPAGYMNAMPVTPELYDQLRRGEKNDKEVEARSVLPYASGSTLRVYVMSIAIDVKYRRWGEGIFQQSYIQLLNGLLDRLSYYAKNHSVRVSHLLATAWTDEGLRMCGSFGMKEIGKDKFGDPIFELDLESARLKSKRSLLPGLKRLLRIYKDL
jgi:hypothetical protein